MAIHLLLLKVVVGAVVMHASKQVLTVHRHFAEKGEPGEEFWLQLELKVLADVGLLGYPSVGKSSILRKVSKAQPEVAAYHFTTLTPVLGVVTISGDRSFVLADIPALLKVLAKVLV